MTDQFVDLTALAPSQGFLIRGSDPGNFNGWSLSAAGDVNADGLPDVIVGALYNSDGSENDPGVSFIYHAGAAYVVFGSTGAVGSLVDGRQLVDLGALSPEQGVVILGDAPEDYAGYSVGGGGDVNGDGIDDVIVGAPGGDDGGRNAGEAYVVFGSAGGFGALTGGRSVIDLAVLSPTWGFVIQGDGAGDSTGTAVAVAGDVNGDDLADLVVGAPGGNGAGKAYIVFGSNSGFGSLEDGRRVLDLSTLSATQGVLLRSDAAGDAAGFAVAAAGDVNGDGLGDVIVGAWHDDRGGDNAGIAYVVFGSTTGLGSPEGGGHALDLNALTPAQGFRIQGDAAGDTAGQSVSTAGDVNGDGIADLLIGARTGDAFAVDAGEAYVVFGSSSGFGNLEGGQSVVDLSTLAPTQGFVIRGADGGDHAGHSVAAAGDINGDGFNDLVVGAPEGSEGFWLPGEAYVVLGSATGYGSLVDGRSVVDLSDLSSTAGFVIRGAYGAGWSVSAAGDVNDDGLADLFVGAPYGPGGEVGEAYVIYGSRAFGLENTITGTDIGDALTGDPGGYSRNDMILALAGDDSALGFAGDDTLDGGDGNDSLDGGGGLDTLRGGAGDDTLSGGSLADTLAGGEGNDVYLVDADDRIVDEPAGRGLDRVYSPVSFSLADGGLNQLYLTGGLWIDGTGNAGNNLLGGNGGANRLSGLGGHDDLYGGGGNDTLEGGSGGDLLKGGAGSDRLVGGSGADRFDFTGPEAADTHADSDVVADYSRAAGDVVDLVDPVNGYAVVGVVDGALQIRLAGGADIVTFTGIVSVADILFV